VRSTSSVCGSTSSATANVRDTDRVERRQSVIASAAAVASSSSDALAMSSPVSSATIVWKLISASSRPCEISGWYGVYAVYHAGFWKTLRSTTPGVYVSW